MIYTASELSYISAIINRVARLRKWEDANGDQRETNAVQEGAVYECRDGLSNLAKTRAKDLLAVTNEFPQAPNVLFAEASLPGWQEWAGDGSAEVLLRAVWEAESARSRATRQRG